MNYKIQTIYRTVVPSFDVMGSMHHGWYWNRSTAERVMTNDGGSRQGAVTEWDVIVMDNGDVLRGVTTEDETTEAKTTNVEKITVYGDTDEDVLAATLVRYPEVWKKILGLDYDAEKMAEQGFREHTKSWIRDKLLLLDVSAEEARVLGMTEDRDRAIADFQAIKREDDEQKAAP